MHQTRGRCGQSIILTLRVSVLRRGAQAWSAYRCAAGFLSGLSRLWVNSVGDHRQHGGPMTALPPKAEHARAHSARWLRANSEREPPLGLLHAAPDIAIGGHVTARWTGLGCIRS